MALPRAWYPVAAWYASRASRWVKADTPSGPTKNEIAPSTVRARRAATREILRPWVRHVSSVQSWALRGHGLRCAASCAAPNTVDCHASFAAGAALSESFASSATCRKGCPWESTGATATRLYGAKPVGYKVNAYPCGMHRITATGCSGPVFRSRQWSNLITQGPPPAAALAQQSGMAGTSFPSPFAEYGVKMKVCRANGRWSWHRSI